MRPDVLPVTPKQSDRVLNGLVRQTPRPKRLKFQRSRIKTVLIIFFDSQGIVHKEFVPDGKIVNAEFYKGEMNFLLKRIQRLPTKLQVFANFSPQKMLQPFIAPPPPHTLHIYLHQTIFYFQVEYEVKRTPPCGCC